MFRFLDRWRNGPEKAKRLIHKAIRQSDAGDYSAAADLLTKAIELAPTNTQAHFERGVARMNLNCEADAIADFSKALDIDPEFRGALDWRSRLYAQLGDFESAARDSELDLQHRPDGPHVGMGVSPQKWADCATYYVEAKNHARARELLQSYFDDYAANVSSYVNQETAPMRLMSKVLLEAGETESALDYARRAYSSDHNVPADVLAFAIALEATGDAPGARKACAEAMAINDQMPGVQELHRRLGE